MVGCSTCHATATQNAEVPPLRQPNALSVSPRASPSADTGGDGNQDRPLRCPVPSIRRKANQHHAARVLGSHLVRDDGRPRTQVARWQDILPHPSHMCPTGRANARHVCITTSRASPLVSMATTRSSPVAANCGSPMFLRLALVAASGPPRQDVQRKHSILLDRIAYRGSVFSLPPRSFRN